MRYSHYRLIRTPHRLRDFAVAVRAFGGSQTRLALHHLDLRGRRVIAGALGLDLFEQHSEGSLPHVQEVLGVTGQRRIPHGTEVAR